MAELQEIRKNINEIDSELVRLFLIRMGFAREVAVYKKEHQLPIFDGVREQELLNRISALSGEDFEQYTRVLFTTLMDLSRTYQHRLLDSPSATERKIKKALETKLNQFPEKAVVACCGTDGICSKGACERLFSSPSIVYYDEFDGVFRAVDQGVCQYGIIPMENSSTGSANTIYDLMRKYSFYIVRSCRLATSQSRFICISKKPEIYPFADKSSIMVVVPQQSGSLYRVISKFYIYDVSITKFVSRPIAGRDSEFMIFFDMDTSVHSAAFLPLIRELETMAGEFQYLGSYCEVTDQKDED